MNTAKYQKNYFMPPESCYDWTKKENIEKAMKKVVSAKKQNLYDLNMSAVELGYNYEG